MTSNGMVLIRSQMALSVPRILPSRSVIELAGASPRKSVPASWCVVPRRSCQKPRPWASGWGCWSCQVLPFQYWMLVGFCAAFAASWKAA